jgi:hypothetical protein
MSTPRTLCITLIVLNLYHWVNTSWYRRLRPIIDSWLVINNVSKYPINMLCYNVLCFGVAIIIIVFHAYIHIWICQVGLNPSISSMNISFEFMSISTSNHEQQCSDITSRHILNIFMYVLFISHNITSTT